MANRRDCLLGVDLGAGSLKATLVGPDGGVLGQASHPITTESPKLGWSEQDPETWYAAFCRAVPVALAAADLSPERLAAIGISAGAHTQVLLDAEDRVIRPAILWSDQRSLAEAQELHARAGAAIIATGYNKVNPTWTLAQLHWLKHHEPEAAGRVHRLFLAKDYLRYRVTGDWHSDVSDSVGSLMADGATGQWSAELCGLIDWPMESLPPVVRPTEVVGRVTEQAATDAGLMAGIPVVAGGNDTTVEVFGAGAVAPGQGAIKLATAAVLYRVVHGPSVHPPVSCYPHVIPELYYTATGTNSCASAHRWLRDTFYAPAEDFDAMDALAAKAPAGADGLIFHPYLQGERGPYWDPYLRADFIGVTFGHGRGHFVRALYEGITFSIRDLLEASPAECRRFSEIRILGGGARSSLWRQIVSDVLGLEICLPANGEASYGAALVAGVGVGLFESELQAASLCAPVIESHRPDPARHALYGELFAVYKDAQNSLAPLNHRLRALFRG